jgi:hypothetical protein
MAYDADAADLRDFLKERDEKVSRLEAAIDALIDVGEFAPDQVLRQALDYVNRKRSEIEKKYQEAI